MLQLHNYQIRKLALKIKEIIQKMVREGTEYRENINQVMK